MDVYPWGFKHHLNQTANLEVAHVMDKGESRCKEVNTMEGLLSLKGNSVISLHSIAVIKLHALHL